MGRYLPSEQTCEISISNNLVICSLHSAPTVGCYVEEKDTGILSIIIIFHLIPQEKVTKKMNIFFALKSGKSIGAGNIKDLLTEIGIKRITRIIDHSYISERYYYCIRTIWRNRAFKIKHARSISHDKFKTQTNGGYSIYEINIITEFPDSINIDFSLFYAVLQFRRRQSSIWEY